VLLLAGIGGMVWYFASQSRHGEDEVPHRNPLLNYRPTPSQKATLKYFYVAVALLLAQVGSPAGEWLSVQQKLHGDAWFWFGHQDYEYVDLGRFWQLYLLAGLFIWLALMARGLCAPLRKPSFLSA